MGNKATVGRT